MRELPDCQGRGYGRCECGVPAPMAPVADVGCLGCTSEIRVTRISGVSTHYRQKEVNSFPMQKPSGAHEDGEVTHQPHLTKYP